MSIFKHPGNSGVQSVIDPESMYKAVTDFGIIPFFLSSVPGFSIEEMTPEQLWISDESLGPWDWKVDVFKMGGIAYGKFLGNKAAFATEDFYKDLVNFRHSQSKFRPEGQILDAWNLLKERGSISSRDLRLAFGLKKSQADNLVTKLQMAGLAITGSVDRVYKGPNLEYKGWQSVTFCPPENFFGWNVERQPAAAASIKPVKTPSWALRFEEDEGQTADIVTGGNENRSPEESIERLYKHISSLFPEATDKQIRKLLM